MDTIHVAGGGSINEGWALELEGEKRADVFEIMRVSVRAWAVGVAPRMLVEAYPPAAIELPMELLTGGGPYTLKPPGNLGALLKSRRDEALRRLRAIELAWHQQSAVEEQVEGVRSFLGIKAFGAARVTGRAVVNLRAGLTADEQRLFGDFDAEISLQVEFDAKLAGNAATLRRSCALHLRVGAQVSLGLNLDELNLSLPEIELTLNRLAKLDLIKGDKFDISTAVDGLTGVFARLARFLGDDDWKQLRVKYSWDAEPKLVLRWVAETHQLQFALAKDTFTETDFDATAAGMEPKLAKFSADLLIGAAATPKTVAKLNNGLLASGSQAKFFQAKVQVIHHPPDIPMGSVTMGPLRLSWAAIKVELSTDELLLGDGTKEPKDITLRARLTIARLSLSLVDDPATVLSVRGVVELTRSSTRIISLEITEPTQLSLEAQKTLVRGAEQVAQLLVKTAAGVADKVAQVLAVLGKLAAAAGKAGGFGLTTAPELLTTVAAAVAELIVGLLQKLAHFASSIDPGKFESLDIELRIALDPFELRQIIISQRQQLDVTSKPVVVNALGFRLDIKPGWRPALLLDLVNDPGAYFMVIREAASAEPELASLSTDLWLKPEGAGTLSPVRDATGDSGDRPGENNAEKPLLEIVATDKKNGDVAFLLAGLRRGKPFFLKRAHQDGYRPGIGLPGFRVIDGPLMFSDPDFDDVGWKVNFQHERVLPFFGMGEGGPKFLETLREGLGSVVTVKGTDGPNIVDRKMNLGLLLEVKAAGVSTEVRFELQLDLDTFEVEFKSPSSFPLRSRRIEERAAGLVWIVEQKAPEELAANAEIEMFKASFANGESGFELNSAKARMELRFDELSTDGTGVVFAVDTFKVGRNGVDLDARAVKRETRLNGLDVPFQFTDGSLSMRSSRLVSASVSGNGQLPPGLVGEVKCSIDLTFKEENGSIVLGDSEVQFDMLGQEIKCHAIRFSLTITRLGLRFRRDNGYHFFFLVTGTLRFDPKEGEFVDGLLKYLKDVEIAIEEMPLTGDPRVLLRHISFQKALKPYREATLFDIFRFELRGFGFHPASPKFEGHPPAINISGQIDLGLGDVMQPSIEFHGLWIAPPKAGESLPRIKADGLGVELNMGGSVKIRGTVLAVDPDTRTLEGRELIPAGVGATGFLGEGQLDISGWGSMQATLGFLEVWKNETPERRKRAFFLYLEMRRLAVEIQTPIWTFYLREVGFGFGFRYTLAGIKQAEQAKSPAELVKILDEVSKYQGDLHRFTAWNPDPDGDKFTLALKGAIQVAPAEDEYDADREKTAQNLFIVDLVVALRSDFTFLMSGRIHLGVNYYNYQENKDDFRSRPHARGYLYISAPRRELLLSHISDPKGHIGEDFFLFKTGSLLRKAVQAVQFSSLLYIRPGLFQYEFGWPDQLSVTLSDKENLKVRVYGGMIFRAAEDGLLYGFNIGADAYIRFGGSVGSRLGVEVSAELDVKLRARLIAYLAWRFKDSLVYALVSLDAKLSFRVHAWMKIDLRFTSFTIHIRFSFSVQFSAAVELAITPEGIGAHVHARIAVQAFGCTLSVGVGFAFNNSRLEEARARVARFLTMSLRADEPAPAPVFAAKEGNKALDAEATAQQQIASPPLQELVPPPKPDGTQPPNKRAQFGDPITATDFWLTLRRAERAPAGLPDQREGVDYAYALLVPREATDKTRSGFYASPQERSLAKAVHTIEVTEKLQVWAFNPDPAAQKFEMVSLNAGDKYEANARWNADVPVEGKPTNTFTLAHLFDECFLTDTHWDEDVRISDDWKEPRSRRVHGRPEPAPTGSEEERNAERYRHQQARRAEAAHQLFDENAYQGRSTAMTMFLDQFVEFTAEGRRPDQPGTLPAHVTDLGLVFYGPTAELEKLAKDARIFKKEKDNTAAGSITVLNPASVWFERVDPVLARERQTVAVDGIKLDWRLQMAFPADAGEKNPEQYLHCYEIRRTIERFEFEPVTIRVKSAATIGERRKVLKDEKELETPFVELIAPDWQFTDTLDGEFALPPGYREAILPRADGGASLDAAIAWLKVLPDTDEVTFTYSVTPLDTAATAALPKSFTVDVQRPEPVIRPALAELRVRQRLQPNDVPTAPPKRPGDIQLYLAIADSAWDDGPESVEIGNVTFEITRIYRLIVQTEEVEPAGHYGSDGATSRLRNPRTLETARRGDERFVEFERDLTGEPSSHVIQFVEPDEETRNKFKRWARLTLNPDDTLPDALSTKPTKPGQMTREELLNLLWTRGPEDSRTAARFVLQTIVRITNQKTGAEKQVLYSQRVPVPIEQVVTIGDEEVPEKKQFVPNKNLVRAVIKPEAMEWPELLALPPLGPGQVQVECGFARFRAPKPGATLQGWLGDSKQIGLLRDAERRILTTVRFAAIPSGIHDAPPDSALRRPDSDLIANYDLYELDLDSLTSSGIAPPKPVSAKDPKGLAINAAAWSKARVVGRIEQLTRDEADLTPDTNKEFNGWQAHYPSETSRALAAGIAPRPGTRPPWYSASESTAHFPERQPRLRFLTHAPEEVPGALMQKGHPTKLLAVVGAKPDSKAAELIKETKWKIPAVKIVAPELATAGWVEGQVNFQGVDYFQLTRPDGTGELRAADLRHALLAIGFAAFEASDPAAVEARRRWLEDPTVLEGLELRLIARGIFKRPLPNGYSKDEEDTGQHRIDLDFRSPVHPFLQDLLGALAYARDEQEEDEKGDGGTGDWFRKYEVLVQPPPAMEALDAASFLSKTPPSADPYGWGILQSLGLAAAIRIFDAESDDFLPPDQLANHVNACFNAALDRWKTFAKTSPGQPFVEFHFKPGRDREAGPFDAVLKEVMEEETAVPRRDDNGLALIQLSLRPEPAAAWEYQTCEIGWRRYPVHDDEKPGDFDTNGTILEPKDWDIVQLVPADPDQGIESERPVEIEADWRIVGTTTIRRVIKSVAVKFTAQPNQPALHVARLAGGAIAALDPIPKNQQPDEPLPTAVVELPPPGRNFDKIRPAKLKMAARIPCILDPDPITKAAIVAVLNGAECLVTWEEIVEVRVQRIVRPDPNDPEKKVEVPGPFAVIKAPAQNTKPSSEKFLWDDALSPIDPVSWEPCAEPLEGELDHPKVCEVFGRFDALSPADWAAACGGDWDSESRPSKFGIIEPARAAYQSFRATLRAALGLAAPTPKDNDEATEDKEAKLLPALIAPYLTWLQRFLDHGALRGVAPNSPNLALAAPVKALPWKLAPEADGCLSLSFLHADRWGRERAYAVKPISRYHHLLANLGVKSQQAAAPLVPDTEKDEQASKAFLVGYGVAVAPRTEQIEPPVVLGSRRRQLAKDESEERDLLEIILARPGEEQLAASNSPLLASLGVPGLLFAFGRRYRHTDWFAGLKDRAFGNWTPDPLPAVPPTLASRPDETGQLDAGVIAELAQELPQLWKGARIDRYKAIPPHYQFVTIPFARAGIVVSEGATALHDDLPRRHLKTQNELIPAGSAVLTLVEDGGEVVLLLTHPLISHADLTPEETRDWFDPAKPDDIAWGPEPDVIYVLQRLTFQEKLKVIDEDLEVRLGRFTEPDALAKIRARGTRFVAHKEPPHIPDPALNSGTVPPASFRIQSRFHLRPEVLGKDAVESVRLTQADWGNLTEVAQFNRETRVAAFAAIIYPHEIAIDLPPKQNETALEWFTRLKAFVGGLRARVEAELALKQPWQVATLQRSDVEASRLEAWIKKKEETGGVTQQDTAAQLHDKSGAKFTVEAEYGHALPQTDFAAVDPDAEVIWRVPPENADADVHLLVWGLASDETLEFLAKTPGFPPLAGKDQLLRRILSRKLLGSASMFQLRVIDSRARLESPLGVGMPGVLERPIKPPPWVIM